MLSSSGYSSSYGTSSSSFSGSTEQPAGWWALALMRIVVGVFWYTQILWKSPSNWGGQVSTCTTNLKGAGILKTTRFTNLCGWMHQEALHPISANLSVQVWSKSISHTFSSSIYADFIQNTVLPHFTFFAWLIFALETFITVSLVLGLFTRLGGLLGAVWALILLVGLWSVPTEWYWTYVLLAGLNLILFAIRAGRYFGLDASLTQVKGPVGNLFRALG